MTEVSQRALLIQRLRDCANGVGSFKSAQGDYGICDDAADMLADTPAAEAGLLRVQLLQRCATVEEARSRGYAVESYLAMLAYWVEANRDALAAALQTSARGGGK